MTAVTGVNILPATVARLAGHPNIIGMKESNSDIAQIADLAALISPDFRIMAGSGSIFYATLCAGLSGGILALATLLPDAGVRIFELTAWGRFDKARALQRQILPGARLISSVRCSRPESRAPDHRVRRGRSASAADAGFRVDGGGAAGSARQVRGGTRMSLLLGALESAIAKQRRRVQA